MPPEKPAIAVTPVRLSAFAMIEQAPAPALNTTMYAARGKRVARAALLGGACEAAEVEGGDSRHGPITQSRAGRGAGRSGDATRA